jgi:hypothetical protein
VTKHDSGKELTRRKFLQLSTTGATSLGAIQAFPQAGSAAQREVSTPPHAAPPKASLYSELLQKWCDGLLAHQVTEIHDPALEGGFLCPACALVHGRCGDAVYPLLRMAHTSGDPKYLRAALLVHEWSERQVSQPDGSWINDVNLNSWQGITVFHAVALAEALHRHGSLLDAATRQRWTARLDRAAKFLDGFITIETGNINYPVTSSYAFALCSQVLQNSHYLERARSMAHASLEYFTANGLLFGEGHPARSLTPKHCRPVDLGYNVEESLPSLALYALLTQDKPVLDQVIAALRTHMEFMLPDGGWDNSWGTRNFKWTWWGSRTSDGCFPGYVFLAPYEPKFNEVARRNLELMAACTRDGLLYGGPDYDQHGDPPCIHHTLTHAKALATVLDHDGAESAQRLPLPRDEAYGVKSYPEIGAHLAAIGEWRATVTEYDYEYAEHGSPYTGGHATGGALTILFHRSLGPISVASPTVYEMIEPTNQQAFRNPAHMTLTPRIELASNLIYTSLSDFAAVLTANDSPDKIVFDVQGRMLTAAHQPPPGGELRYHLVYRLTESAVEIVASATDSSPAARFILPVVSRAGEVVEQPDAQTIRITKPMGSLVVRTDAAQGFETGPKERTFNLVPGFECLALAVTLPPGQEVRLQLEASVRK